MSRTQIACPRCKTPPPVIHLTVVRCPECGAVYTRATAGSTVEVACRKCKAVTVVVAA